jgi:ribosome-binding factor A
MKSRQLPRRPFADEAEREDFLELSGRRPSSHAGRGAGRKTLQLCSQVADTLNLVLSGQHDDLLRDLQVMSVVPAPDATQLLVTVYPVTQADAAIDADEVQKRLLAAASRLRGEVAASITRKKTPKLLFQVVQFVR